jgi:hypothetical protein
MGAQQRLIGAVQAGRHSPARANRQNRRLSREIDRLREDIAHCRRLIAADSTAAAGGFSDLTLTQYAALARQPAYLRWSTMDPVDRRTVLLVGAMLALCLGAGWIYLAAGRAAAFGSSLTGSPPESVVIWCHNAQLTPVQLVLDPSVLPPAAEGRAYWVEIAVRGAGGTPFQALGGLVEARGRGDLPGADPARVVIDAGLYHAQHFWLASILPPGPPPEAVRVRLLGGRGGVLYEGVHAWPQGGLPGESP